MTACCGSAMNRAWRLSHPSAQVVEQVNAGDQAEEGAALEDDGDVVLGEDRQQGLHRPIGLDGLQPAGHRAGDRILEAAVVMEHLQQDRSEEHTSELQSLMRISYAVFCLKKKKK